MGPRDKPEGDNRVYGLTSAHPGVREEELLAVLLIAGDRRLPLVGEHPVDEGLAEVGLHAGTLFRADLNDAVLVEQALVALDGDLEVALVAEGDPGGAVGQRVGAHADGGVEGGAHARAGLAVPGAAVGGGIDAGRLPQLELGLVGAGVVGAGGEARPGLPDHGAPGAECAAAGVAG